MRLTRSKNDHGVALITVLMMLALISGMLVATTALVIKDQKARFQDHNRTDTFYAALAGLEQITNDLGRVFNTNYAPSDAELATVTAQPPNLANMRFQVPGGAAGSGYRITRGDTDETTIQTGAFAGLRGMITEYTIDVTAQSPAGSESSLRRKVNTIAIPVFQFGIFSETDLSFFPGPTFNFGGRVHTNGNLFLAKDDNGNQLILNDYVTAYRDVIRHVMANGNSTTPQYDGIVKISTVADACLDINATTCRQIALTEGSVDNNNVHSEAFHATSLNTYGGYIKHGANGADHPQGSPLQGTPMGTGAQRLELPITADGSPAISLIRRPAVNEPATNPGLYEQRYYTMASVRILLSDRPEDLDNLPGRATPNAQPLSNWVNAKAGGAYAGPWPPSSPTPPAIPYARWPYTNPVNTPLVDGYIKIEMQNQAGGSWTDVTSEIMALGYWGESLVPSVGQTGYCAGDPEAVIRIQRFKDNATGGCSTTDHTNFWSNTLYDAREGAWRDDNTTYANNNQPLNYTRMYHGGIMHYVELDIRNLRDWLASKRQTNSIMETTGYVVYFSDRRGNHDNATVALPETGEYGWEDVVHPGGANPNTGEDLNGNGTLQTYGRRPWKTAPDATYWPTGTFPNGTLAPFQSTAQVNDLLPAAPNLTWHIEKVARASRPNFFRRALKLVNGNRENMRRDTPGRQRLGLTVVAENPVYIHGDYNATTSEGVPQTYENDHVACAVIADAVTLLSNQWSDRTSFLYPHSPNQRTGNTTTYRTAVISGKGMAFPRPDSTAADFGTDGGTHNFLRYLEAGSRTLNYKGSIVSLYYNAQATGTYKCCTNVYGAPTRAYSFDEDFRNPALLPPRTPMFRTIDVTNFSRLSEPPETTPNP
jgi:hypothetical protein